MATSTGEAGGQIYGGGNQVFNAEPYVAFQSNLLAREAAKSDAIDDSYKGMIKGLTPAGLRSQDVGGFVDKVNGLQNFYLQNADKVKNPRLDNGSAASEFNSRFNDAMGYAQSSKDAVARATQFNQFKQKAQLTGQGLTDQNLSDYANDEKPLTDTTHKDFDISTLNLTPKALDLQKHLQLYEHLKPNQSTSNVATSPDDPSKSIVTTSASFSPDDIKAVANRAMTSYQTDPSFKNTIDKISQDPTLYKQYNDLYSHVMGKGFDIGHPEELAFAHDLSSLQQNNTSQEVIPNERYLENQKQADRVALKGVPTFKEKQDQQDNTFIPKYVDNLISTSKPTLTGADIPVDNAMHPLEQKNTISVDPTLINALSTKGNKLSGLNYNKSDKTFTPSYYKTDDKGQVIKDEAGIPVHDVELEKPITRQQLEINLGSKVVSKANESKEMNKIVNAPASLPKGATPFTAKDGNTYFINPKTKQVFTKEGKEVQ